MGSDSSVNYSLRPSKSIERKMMLDILKEICTPNVIDDYQYIGFGASFFVDFNLFHKGLGIKKMISIEGNVSPEGKKRCDYNKPFSCIKLESGKSYEVLPKLNWDLKTIAWLDYDKGLQNYMIDDIDTYCRNVKENGLLFISLRNEFIEKTIEDFKSKFDLFLPSKFDVEDFEPFNTQITLRKIFLNVIENVIVESQSSLDVEDRLIFKQFFNLTYQDGIEMFTFGGIFIKKSEAATFNQYHFLNKNFISQDEAVVNISFPIITNKEYHLLNSLLPDLENNYDENPQIEFIPSKHRKTYKYIYLYYPSYLESLNL